MIDHILSRLGALVSRGKATGGQVGARTLLGVSGLDGEQFTNVELVLPPGYVALPPEGADLVILQVNGHRDHKVALAGDATADTLEDLEPGEVGLSRGGQQLMLRVSGVEVITSKFAWGVSRDELKRLVQEAFVPLFNEHTHPTPQGQSGPPTQQMTDAHLTSSP